MRLRAVEPGELAAGPGAITEFAPRPNIVLGVKGVLAPIGLVSAASTAVLLIGLEGQDRWSSAPRHVATSTCDVVPDKPWWKWACADSPDDERPTSPLAPTSAPGPVGKGTFGPDIPSGAAVGWTDLQGAADASSL